MEEKSTSIELEEHKPSIHFSDLPNATNSTQPTQSSNSTSPANFSSANKKKILNILIIVLEVSCMGIVIFNTYSFSLFFVQIYTEPDKVFHPYGASIEPQFSSKYLTTTTLVPLGIIGFDERNRSILGLVNLNSTSLGLAWDLDPDEEVHRRAAQSTSGYYYFMIYAILLSYLFDIASIGFFLCVLFYCLSKKVFATYVATVGLFFSSPGYCIADMLLYLASLGFYIGFCVVVNCDSCSAEIYQNLDDETAEYFGLSTSDDLYCVSSNVISTSISPLEPVRETHGDFLFLHFVGNVNITSEYSGCIFNEFCQRINDTATGYHCDFYWPTKLYVSGDSITQYESLISTNYYLQGFVLGCGFLFFIRTCLELRKLIITEHLAPRRASGGISETFVRTSWDYDSSPPQPLQDVSMTSTTTVTPST